MTTRSVRDETTLKPVSYYLMGRHFYVCDPMLATGQFKTIDNSNNKVSIYFNNLCTNLS